MANALGNGRWNVGRSEFVGECGAKQRRSKRQSAARQAAAQQLAGSRQPRPEGTGGYTKQPSRLVMGAAFQIAQQQWRTLLVRQSRQLLIEYASHFAPTHFRQRVDVGTRSGLALQHIA